MVSKGKALNPICLETVKNTNENFWYSFQMVLKMWNEVVELMPVK